MRKYWIIENGRPAGPFTASELKVRRDFTATLPVWCAELTDWTTVGLLPELASLLPEEISEPSDNSEPSESSENSENSAPQPWIVISASDEINGVERPKTYMGWNIVMLLCCCVPAGVAGLIFSSQVNRNWIRGDVKGAQKASEYAQWCIILGIVLGLVAWPFQLLFSF